MTEFKIGDVVLLKSGSPKMTIQKVGIMTREMGEMDYSLKENIIECSWFDSQNILQKSNFEKDSLKLEETSK